MNASHVKRSVRARFVALGLGLALLAAVFSQPMFSTGEAEDGSSAAVESQKVAEIIWGPGDGNGGG